MVDEPRRPTLTALHLGDPADRWEALGFTVVDDTIALAGLRLVLGRPSRASSAGRSPGSSRSPTSTASRRPSSHGPSRRRHATRTARLSSTTSSSRRPTSIGPPRRWRCTGCRCAGFARWGTSPPRAAFGRASGASARGSWSSSRPSRCPPGPAAFWGLVVVLPDLGWLASHLGSGVVGEPKPAVQPGRQIVTLKRAAGLGQPLAFMSPDPA